MSECNCRYFILILLIKEIPFLSLSLSLSVVYGSSKRDNLLIQINFFLTQFTNLSLSIHSFSFRDYRLLISSIDDESIGNKSSFMGNMFHTFI